VDPLVIPLSATWNLFLARHEPSSAICSAYLQHAHDELSTTVIGMKNKSFTGSCLGCGEPAARSIRVRACWFAQGYGLTLDLFGNLQGYLWEHHQHSRRS
jgi:hypothetical protein